MKFEVMQNFKMFVLQNSLKSSKKFLFSKRKTDFYPKIFFFRQKFQLKNKKIPSANFLKS